MKKLLPILFLFSLSQISFAQLPSLNMTLQDQWDPDTLPNAGGREYNDIWGYVDCFSNEYGIIGSAGMIHFFNITDPKNVEELAYFPGGEVTTWRDIKTYKNRAYAVSDNTSEGMMIFDLSNIQDTIIKTYHSDAFFAKAHNIYIDEDNGRLYACGTNTQSSGLIVLDIETDPDNPQLLASVSLPGGGYIHDLYVKDNKAYCSHGYNGFYVWDFTTPTTPVMLANVVTGGYNHSSWITDDGLHAIYAEEVPIGMPLGVIDLTNADSGDIDIVNTFKFPLLAPTHVDNRPHNPFVRGDYLIVSYYHDGVQIFDISDQLNPVQVAYYDTYDNSSYSGYEGTWGVYPYFPSGVIIASDINKGLLVLTADSLEFAPVYPNLNPDATVASDMPSPLCKGSSALLTVSSGYDLYEWYKSGQPIGVDQNFLIAEETGTYHVEITDGLCFSTSEDFVLDFIQGADLSSVMSGSFEFCQNDDLLVEAPDTFDLYIWLQDGNVYQQGGTSLTITEAGDYLLIADLNGCSTTSDTISVSVLDLPIAEITNNDLSFCVFEQLILEASDGGVQYNWYLNNIEVDQSTVNYYVVNQSGNYKVEVSDGMCSSVSEEVTVVENELPDVNLSFMGLNGSVDSNNVNLCYGESFILAVPADATAQFQWYKDGVETGIDANSLEVSEGGQYYVAIINGDNCSDESELIEVEISQPIAYIQLDGDDLVNVDQWTSYQWYMDGNIIIGATDPTYSPTASGEYHCVITNDVGCESVLNYIQITIDGLENITELISFSAHPNPVEDILNIKINTTELLNFDIQIIHSSGKIIENRNIEIIGLQNISFDLSDKSSGVYFIRFVTNDKQLIQRLVKI